MEEILKNESYDVESVRNSTMNTYEYINVAYIYYIHIEINMWHLKVTANTLVFTYFYFNVKLV